MTLDDRRRAPLRFVNGGDTLLELVVEPYGRDYWLKPGEGVVVTTVGTAGDVSWPGTSRPDEPFEVEYRRDRVTVHANGVAATVVDFDGRDLECGYQRPGYLV